MATKLTRLEDLSPGTRVRGVLPDRSVNVVQVQPHGDSAVTLTFRDDRGQVGEQILFRNDEARLEIEEAAGAWTPTTAPHAARTPLIREAAREAAALDFRQSDMNHS